jgi:hypothetical protein
MPKGKRRTTSVNYGAGWILYEESLHQNTRKLVSILPARRPPNDVSKFMQQIYIDRTCTLQERLDYKKSPKSAAYKVESDRLTNPLHIGHDPWLMDIYAHRIFLKAEGLEFTYRVLVNPSADPRCARFEDRTQVLEVEGSN